MSPLWLFGCSPDAVVPPLSEPAEPVESTPSSPSSSVPPDPTTTVPSPVTSACTVTEQAVDCPFDIVRVSGRDVRIALPEGTPPDGGWPVIVAYQGSFFSAEFWFSARASQPFGAYDEALAVATWLGAGFAVVAPETIGDATFWQTNVPPWSVVWQGSDDDDLVLALLDAIDGGDLGPLDPERLYATGISSGGFMTSRMAVSYPGVFRALAIHSGSYATCGAVCFVPRPLPADHPPTLFVHGRFDPVVPERTAEAYSDALADEGHETELHLEDGGHEWLPDAGDAILVWFSEH